MAAWKFLCAAVLHVILALLTIAEVLRGLALIDHTSTKSALLSLLVSLALLASHSSVVWSISASPAEVSHASVALDFSDCHVLAHLSAQEFGIWPSHLVVNLSELDFDLVTASALDCVFSLLIEALLELHMSNFHSVLILKSRLHLLLIHWSLARSG